MKIFMVMLFIGIYFSTLSVTKIYCKPRKFQAMNQEDMAYMQPRGNEIDCVLMQDGDNDELAYMAEEELG